MNQNYRLYHPKWFRRRVPIFWWLKKLAYTKFISRELTSLAVGYGAILLMLQIWALSAGNEAYDRFTAVLQSPAMVMLNLVVLAALLFHTITWLSLAPKAMVVQVAGRRVPNGILLAGQYLAWIMATALLAWFLLGGVG